MKRSSLLVLLVLGLVVGMVRPAGAAQGDLAYGVTRGGDLVLIAVDDLGSPPLERRPIRGLEAGDRIRSLVIRPDDRRLIANATGADGTDRSYVLSTEPGAGFGTATLEVSASAAPPRVIVNLVLVPFLRIVVQDLIAAVLALIDPPPPVPMAPIWLIVPALALAAVALERERRRRAPELATP